MSSNPKPVATVKFIQARFGKASSDFIVKAVAAEMTEDQVAEMYYSEMVKENEELKAKLAAMEEEMVALKAKAEQMTVTETEEEDDEEEKMVLMPAARAKAKGVQPVKTTGGVSHIASAAQAWNEKVADKVKAGMRHQHAVAAVNRENPGLRQRMVDEANA